DAKTRLAALHQPIPRPTKAAVARNKAELASRSESTIAKRAMGLLKKGPDVAQAAKVGNPSLADPEPVSAHGVLGKEAQALMEPASKGSVGVEIINPNQPSPGEATLPTDMTPPGGSPFGNTPAATTPTAGPDPNELKPS